jgi:hypothetical protein
MYPEKSLSLVFLLSSHVWSPLMGESLVFLHFRAMWSPPMVKSLVFLHFRVIWSPLKKHCQRYWDVPRKGQSLVSLGSCVESTNELKLRYPYILVSCSVHTRKNCSIIEGCIWTSPCLTAICFQFSMLSIYHPHGCHLKGRTIGSVLKGLLN